PQKQIVYGHRPVWHRGFGLRDFPPAVDSRLIRVVGAIGADHGVAQQIDIPDYPGSGGEVVSPLRGYLLLGYWPVVTLAAHLDGEHRRAVVEPHASAWPRMECGIRTK